MLNFASTRFWFVLSLPLAFAACSQGPSDVVRDAAEALGGQERIAAIQTLTMEGTAANPNLGQNITPDAELPVWEATSFQRTIDPANGRMRERQTQEARFLFANDNTRRIDAGVDGDVAYNVGPNGPVRASADAASERRRTMLHHPVAIVLAALDPGAQVANLREEGGLKLVDITTAQGEQFTLGVDAANVPTHVTSLGDQPNLGDVAIETSFSDYEDVDGVMLPRRLTTKTDRWMTFDLNVSKNTINAGADVTGDLAAPDAVKAAALPDPPRVYVDVEHVAPGIWWLAGSGNHRSVVFEFADHLTIMETPVNEARTLAAIAAARQLSDKPLTDAIVTHHHFDHSGGLRAAVAEGLRIITYKDNVEFFKELTSRPHTVAPDALAKSPKPLDILPVDDEMTLKDDAMEVRLYHVRDNPREGTNLFAYIPRDRLLVQADLYDSSWMYHHWGGNFLDNVRLRNLNVAIHAPIHGIRQTHAEVLKTLAGKGVKVN